jgi:hypothetical protein
VIELSAFRRPAEDILSRSIRFTLGGVDYVLPVRSIAANRDWKTHLDDSTSALLSSLDAAGDDLATVYGALSSQVDVLIDLLIEYAPTLLPTRDEIEQIEPDATSDVLDALREVWRAANPLVAISLDAMTPLEEPTPTSSPPTSGRRKSTAGSRTTSKVD